MTENGKVVYGFFRSAGERNFGPIGIGEGHVTSVVHKDIGALISDVPLKPFSMLPRDTVIRHLVSYQSVLEKAMADLPVIPLRFGTLVGSVEAVACILENGYEQVDQYLKEMIDKIEIDVTAVWRDMSIAMKDIGENEEILALKKTCDGMSAGDDVTARVAVGKAVKSVLDRKKETMAQKIRDGLLPLSERHLLLDVLDDAMILNLAVLINRSAYHRFEGRVVDLDREFEDTVDFKLLGPLPPHGFCTLEVRTCDFRTIDGARKALCLGERVSADQIRKAYKEMVMTCHPDCHPGDPGALRRYKEISRAFRTVTDYYNAGLDSFAEKDVCGWLSVQPVRHAPAWMTL